MLVSERYCLEKACRIGAIARLHRIGKRADPCPIPTEASAGSRRFLLQQKYVALFVR